MWMLTSSWKRIRGLGDESGFTTPGAIYLDIACMANELGDVCDVTFVVPDR